MPNVAFADANPDELKRLQESRTILLTALLGVRGMAHIEAATGSKTWAKAVAEIDRCLKEAGCAP